MRTILSCVLVLVSCCVVAADDKKDEKIDARKLVGRWEPKKPRKNESAVIEFHKDGKLTITSTIDGEKQKLEGTYKVDGDKLTVTLNREGKKDDLDPITVTKLTDAELVTKERGEKEQTFTRLKDK